MNASRLLPSSRKCFRCSSQSLLLSGERRREARGLLIRRRVLIQFHRCAASFSRLFCEDERRRRHLIVVWIGAQPKSLKQQAFCDLTHFLFKMRIKIIEILPPPPLQLPFRLESEAKHFCFACNQTNLWVAWKRKDEKQSNHSHVRWNHLFFSHRHWVMLGKQISLSLRTSRRQ